MRLERLTADHYRQLDHLPIMLSELDVNAFNEAPYCHAIVDDNGDVLACGGVIQYWPGRGESWAIFNPRTKANALKVVRLMRDHLDTLPFRRIEATVICGFARGRRFAELLGFELEKECVRKYLPDGSDCDLFARVK